MKRYIRQTDSFEVLDASDNKTLSDLCRDYGGKPEDWKSAEVLGTSDKQKQINALKGQLIALDLASIRPLREGENARVSSLKDQAVALRAALTTLEAS